MSVQYFTSRRTKYDQKQLYLQLIISLNNVSHPLQSCNVHFIIHEQLSLCIFVMFNTPETQGNNIYRVERPVSLSLTTDPTGSKET